MIQTLQLFRPLNDKLISVLRSLTKKDWELKTVAREWTVKDVAAHLLDGNIKGISAFRDRHVAPPDQKLNDYGDIVVYLNRQNAAWVEAMKRVSPEVLVQWLDETHDAYVHCLEALDPSAEARFSVAWAGEEVSSNWFHVAREFTEKWHHQQQIREAVGQPGILTKEFYGPVLDTFMRALPFKYKDMHAPEGTRVGISVGTPVNRSWTVVYEQEKWILLDGNEIKAQTTVTIPSDVSWKLFTKAVRLEEVNSLIMIQGEERFAWPALQMVTVMA